MEYKIRCAAIFRIKCPDPFRGRTDGRMSLLHGRILYRHCQLPVHAKLRSNTSATNYSVPAFSYCAPIHFNCMAPTKYPVTYGKRLTRKLLQILEGRYSMQTTGLYGN